MSKPITITVNYTADLTPMGWYVWRKVEDGKIATRVGRIHRTQEEALDAIKGAQRADRAAASRLGLEVKHTAG